MSAACAFLGVSKRYFLAKSNALDSLSCEFPTGSICGLVGPNGAGKTTAFSVVSGFLSPDSGSVEILGEESFDPGRLKGRLGVLPQDAELPDRHTPMELLVHLARLQGMSRREARGASEDVLDVVRLTDRRTARISTRSHGMRRRVAVASALLGDPDLVILDEPMAGLDPAQARSLRAALNTIRGDRTLIISSHNMDELERLCDWVVMIDDGRCVHQGPVRDVVGEVEHMVWTLTTGGGLDLDGLRQCTDHLVELHDSRLHIRGPDLDRATLELMQELLRQEVVVRQMTRGASLEQRFVDVAEGGKPAAT